MIGRALHGSGLGCSAIMTRIKRLDAGSVKELSPALKGIDAQATDGRYVLTVGCMIESACHQDSLMGQFGSFFLL
jgi:hypothetical protein